MRQHKLVVMRWTAIVVSISVLVALILIAGHFTGQSGEESRANSEMVADYIETLVGEMFPINPRDVFWTLTINLMIRKVAHFLQFLFIGIAMCTTLNLILRKVVASFFISAVGCLVLAYLDEYRQQFIEGRTPQWLDVRIDCYGSITGIVLTTLVFVIYFKIKRLQQEIRELKERSIE